MAFFLYLIVDPRDRRIFYVGQTGNMEGRIEAHMLRDKGVTRRRIDEILTDGMAPQFIEVQAFKKRSEVLDAEQSWIYNLAKRDVVLLNKEARRLGKAKEKQDGASGAPRAGERWTAKEDEALLALIDKGSATRKAIAKKFGRTVGAIRSRLLLLRGSDE